MSDDPKFFERPQPGWRMISRGLYVDQEDNLHLFAGEFLVAQGYADTQENREALYSVGPEAIRKIFNRPDLPAYLTSKDGKVERR